jgi:hypothetical protein
MFGVVMMFDHEYNHAARIAPPAPLIRQDHLAGCGPSRGAGRVSGRHTSATSHLSLHDAADAGMEDRKDYWRTGCRIRHKDMALVNALCWLRNVAAGSAVARSVRKHWAQQYKPKAQVTGSTTAVVSGKAYPTRLVSKARVCS